MTVFIVCGVINKTREDQNTTNTFNHSSTELETINESSMETVCTDTYYQFRGVTFSFGFDTLYVVYPSAFKLQGYNTQPSYAKATEGHSETLACASEAQQSEGVKATVGIYPRLNRNKIKAEWYITLQAGKRVVRKFDNYNNMVWYIIGIHENIGIYFLGIVSKKKRGGNKKDRRRRPATDEWSDGK